MENKEILETMRKRFKLMLEADQENRRDGLRDMKFINVPGEQWDINMKKERGDRPCYEFNKLRVTCKRIINDMRSNRPSGKIRGVEGGDKKVAEIFEGLVRNIWNISDGDTVVDYAAEYQVSSGMGAWRIVTDYTTDTMFNQDIQLKELHNPYCLFADPSAKDMLKRDARDWILTEKIARDAYEKQYKGKEVIDFESHEFDDEEEWQDSEEVRVAEYWWKEPIQKEIWQLQDGKVIEADTDEAAAILKTQPELIKNKRTVDTNKIMMVIASGEAILEGPIEWAGSMFPFVMVFGEYMIIDGETKWYGAGRFAKDAQQSYNVARTAITETIAQQPQSKYWVTVDQAKGHVDKWAEAHQKNFPFLLYNPDPKAPGPPNRMGSADVPVALIQESQLASNEIKEVTGIFDDDVGAESKSQSGRAIYARQQQGQVATFNYQDNMSKAIRRTWELLIDLIPQIYDTEREMRILGSDGAEDYKIINQFAQGPKGPIKINDLSAGRYDVTITTGPSFSTRRQEAAETYQQLLQGNPDIFPIIGDLIFKSMDLPYSEDIAERMKAMLPPQIQAIVNEGQDVPPEVQQMMQQAQQAMQMVEQQAQAVQQQANEADIAKSEVEKLIADLEKKQAQFEAKVAQDMAKIAEKDARLTVQKINQESDGVIETSRQEAGENIAQFQQALAQDTAQVLSAIQGIASELSQHTMQSIDEIRAEKNTEKKPSYIKSERVNGELRAIPVWEDDDEPTIN